MSKAAGQYFTRRLFLAGGLGGVALGANAPAHAERSAAVAADPWAQADAIVARIRRPSFPAREFKVTSHGAIGDGRTDSSTAIAAAIRACNLAGGGHVVVPAGSFVTGPIRLRRNVDLHVAKGATLLFTPNPARYLPVVLTRFEGNDCYNYAPLIYAYGIGNIAVTGEGTLDGRASDQAWWPWRGDPAFGWRTGQPTQFPDSDRLRAQGEARVPVAQRVYGAGHYLRPSFVQFHSCTRAQIAGVTIHVRGRRSRALPSAMHPHGLSIRSCARASPSATSRSPALGRTTMAAIPNAARMC